jgi:hypothetical protein
VREQCDTLSSFLDFLLTQGVHLAKLQTTRTEEDGRERRLAEPYLYPYESPAIYDELIAKFYGIDSKKMEQEKLAMLKDLRAKSEEKK